jgi:hypothetical protein
MGERSGDGASATRAREAAVGLIVELPSVQEAWGLQFPFVHAECIEGTPRAGTGRIVRAPHKYLLQEPCWLCQRPLGEEPQPSADS